MRKLKIYFNNFKNPILKTKISKLFLYALNDKLKELNFENQGDFEVDIRFVSKQEIKDLNKMHRNIDKETDVLSFPLIDFNNEKINKNYNMLGDIVICKDIAKLQAKKFRHGKTREICFLALHGFLHLLGHDHLNKNDEEKMMTKTEEILNKYKVKR